MIDYKYPEEKIVLIFFTEKLNRSDIKNIVLRESLENNQEARKLSQFFWEMATYSATCKKDGVKLDLPCEEGSEFWIEKLYNTLSGFLIESGYESIWDDEVDKA